jgi:hypothetical protein
MDIADLPLRIVLSLATYLEIQYTLKLLFVKRISAIPAIDRHRPGRFSAIIKPGLIIDRTDPSVRASRSVKTCQVSRPTIPAIYRHRSEGRRG